MWGEREGREGRGGDPGGGTEGQGEGEGEGDAAEHRAGATGRVCSVLIIGLAEGLAGEVVA